MSNKLYGVFYAPEESLLFDLLYTVVDPNIAEDVIAQVTDPHEYKVVELKPVDKIPIVYSCYINQDGVIHQHSYIGYTPQDDPQVNVGHHINDCKHVTIRTTTDAETALRIARETLEEHED